MAKAIFYLEKIELTDIEVPKKLEEEDLITVDISLLYPRYNKQSVISSWAMDYGKYLEWVKTLETDKTPSDKNLNTYFNKEIKKCLKGILFKEIVEGDFGLKIDVTAVNKTSELGKFINGVLKAGAGAYLGVLTGGLSVVLAAATMQGGKAWFGGILSGKDKIYTLCSACKHLNIASPDRKHIPLVPKEDEDRASAKGAVEIMIETS